MTLFPGCHGIFVAQDAHRYKERIILSCEDRFSPSLRFLPSLPSFTSPPSLFKLVANLSRKKKFSLLAECLWSVQDLEDPVVLFALHLGSGKRWWLQTSVQLRMQECSWPCGQARCLLAPRFQCAAQWEQGQSPARAEVAILKMMESPADSIPTGESELDGGEVGCCLPQSPWKHKVSHHFVSV